MLKYARVVAATLALTTALVVSGCSSDLPATPSPSPTPTATMAVDTAPPDALACGDLVADATIHDLMGPATLFAQVAPPTPLWASFTQAGLTGCGWELQTDSALTTLSIEVFANGASKYQPYSPLLLQQPELDTIGDQSQLACMETVRVSCEAGFTAGHYWASAQFYSVGAETPIATVRTELGVTLNEVAAVLSTMPDAQPIVPTMMIDGPATCATLDPSGAAAAAMSTPEQDVEGTDFSAVSDGDAPILHAAYAQSGFAGCEWTAVDAENVLTFKASMALLPGSLWAWESTDRVGWEPATVAGATEAFIHYTEQYAVFDILVKDSWLQATTSLGAAERLRLVAGLETIITSLPIVPA